MSDCDGQDLFFLPLDAVSKLDFDRDIVIEILSRAANQPVQYESLRYPDRSGGEVHWIDDDLPERFERMSFTRFGGRTMMERLFQLADRFDAVLAWTDIGEDDPASCVTRADLLERADTYKRLGIVVARDASHLNFLIKGSTFEDNGW